MDNETIEAVQNVVDRVAAYQEGAPDGTVESELRTALADAGVQLDDPQVQALASAIETDPGSARAADVLA